MKGEWMKTYKAQSDAYCSLDQSHKSPETFHANSLGDALQLALNKGLVGMGGITLVDTETNKEVFRGSKFDVLCFLEKNKKE